MKSSLFWIAAGLLIASFQLASGCYCDHMNDDDDDWSGSPDVDCDCGGLTQLIYDECHGEVTVSADVLTPQEFAEDCMRALDEDGPEAGAYRCYIEAACTSDDCEEASERLGLCNL